MLKEEVKSGIAALDLEQCHLISFEIKDDEPAIRLTVQKKIGGVGYEGDLSMLFLGWANLSVVDAQWVSDSLNNDSNNSVSGRPRCPIC